MDYIKTYDIVASLNNLWRQLELLWKSLDHLRLNDVFLPQFQKNRQSLIHNKQLPNKISYLIMFWLQLSLHVWVLVQIEVHCYYRDKRESVRSSVCPFVLFTQISVPSSSLWFLMDPYGSIWFYIFSYGFIWFLTVFQGSLWFFMVPYGSLGFLRVP